MACSHDFLKLLFIHSLNSDCRPPSPRKAIAITMEINYSFTFKVRVKSETAY